MTLLEISYPSGAQIAFQGDGPRFAMIGGENAIIVYPKNPVELPSGLGGQTIEAGSALIVDPRVVIVHTQNAQDPFLGEKTPTNIVRIDQPFFLRVFRSGVMVVDWTMGNITYTSIQCSTRRAITI